MYSIWIYFFGMGKKQPINYFSNNSFFYALEILQAVFQMKKRKDQRSLYNESTEVEET